MLFSNLVLRHKTPAPRFAPALFLGLVGLFSILGEFKPSFGLAGVGTVAIITSVLVELNRQRIWDDYRKQKRHHKSVWTVPNQTYYTINVRFLWPFIFFLGLVCLWAAYLLS